MKEIMLISNKKFIMIIFIWWCLFISLHDNIWVVDALNMESNIIDTRLTTSMASNDFFDIKFDKCWQIIKESCTNIIKIVENTILSIDYVEEMEIMHMKDAEKFMRDTSAKVDGFPSMTKEIFDNHCSNKGCNTILIIEKCDTYLHY